MLRYKSVLCTITKTAILQLAMVQKSVKRNILGIQLYTSIKNFNKLKTSNFNNFKRTKGYLERNAKQTQQELNGKDGDKNSFDKCKIYESNNLQ